MLMKNKIVALLSVLVISSSANAFAYATGDYHEVASQEEHEAIQQKWEETKKEHNNNIVRSEFLENKIQAPLIKYNHDKLKKANSPYDDGLYHVYIENSPNMGVGGESILNYIYITKGYINAVSSNDLSDYNVYGLSAIAFMYAHESGHWYYNDAWLENNQKDNNQTTKLQEIRADKFSLSVIDKVPQFSTGGQLMFSYRYDNGNGISYPTKTERINIGYNYIKNTSNNRVYFENDKLGTNHLLVSDLKEEYEFEVYPPNQYSPKTILNEVNEENKTILMNSTDRAFYVSGAIAWAIKNGVWNKNSISYEDAHKYFADLPQNVNATAIIARSQNSYKIIDWYFSDEYLTQKQKTELNNYLEMLKASYQQ